MPNNQSWSVDGPRAAPNISLSADHVVVPSPAISVSAASSSSITVALVSPVAGAIRYTLERSTNGQAWSVVDAFILPGEFPYTDTGLSAETTYYYRARAADETETSGYSGVVGETTQAAAGQGYVPLDTYDFEQEAVGAALPADWNISEYTDQISKTGTKSLKCNINATQPGSCPIGNNSRVFGGDRDLPVMVTEGYTVWLAMWQYIPATFSFGALWDKNNVDHTAEATACGLQNNEGAGTIKWLRFTPNATGARSYFNIGNALRQVDQPAGAGIFLGTEADHASWVYSEPWQMPREQWVHLQLAVRVAKDKTGWLRAWVNGTLTAETIGYSTITESDTGLDRISIGNYWNGYPYTDGAPRDLHFFADEIIVATDMPGYGAPTGADNAGNAIIDPSHVVGDFL